MPGEGELRSRSRLRLRLRATARARARARVMARQVELAVAREPPRAHRRSQGAHQPAVLARAVARDHILLDLPVRDAEGERVG